MTESRLVRQFVHLQSLMLNTGQDSRQGCTWSPGSASRSNQLVVVAGCLLVHQGICRQHASMHAVMPPVIAVRVHARSTRPCQRVCYIDALFHPQNLLYCESDEEKPDPVYTMQLCQSQRSVWHLYSKAYIGAAEQRVPLERTTRNPHARGAPSAIPDQWVGESTCSGS